MAELLSRYRRRKLSPVETVRAVLDRIDRHDGVVNAWCCVTCSYSITSSARKKKGMLKLGTFSAWMIAPMRYIIQVDSDNDVIITEGDAAG